jgi:hypothetical protein
MATKITLLTALAGLAGMILWGGDYSWISKVSAFDARITAVEGQKETIQRMDYNIQIIAKKVGVRPLKKDSGE